MTMPEIKDCETCAHDAVPAREAPCNTCTRIKDGKFLPQPSNYQPRRQSIDDCTPQEWTDSANAVQVGGRHYAQKVVQPWDYIVSNGLGYLEGNVVKYVSRWRDKGGVEDLRKARHYLDKLIETATK